MMFEHDEDGNQVIDFDEFLKMIIKINAEMANDPIMELKKAVRQFIGYFKDNT